MKIIAVGSEGTVYEDRGKIIKTRKKKGYRIREIDEKLRKIRSRAEFRIMDKLYNAGVKVPKPLKHDEKKMQITMEMIAGKRLSEDFMPGDAKKAGALVASIHNLGIIHGDLTTANIIKKDDDLYLIDFGLGYYSKKDEDMASDLFLFKNAIKSKHNDVYKEAYNSFIASYKKHIGKEFKGIDTHLKDIEDRRRYNESY
jgi:Kae1-associated kinase Bud32